MSRGDLSSEQADTPNRRKARLGSLPSRQDWYRSAYRQMVEKDDWESAELADFQTQAMLEAMPEKAAGQYFKDPNGKYRIIKPEQREDPKVTRHRLSSIDAWLNTLPKKTETRYADLAELDPDYPHPGEDEQVAEWLGIGPAAMQSPPPILVAKGPVATFKPTMTDVPPVDVMPPAKRPPSGGGKGGSISTTGGLPPQPKRPTTQGTASIDAKARADSDILASVLGAPSGSFEMPPVSNFDTPKNRPYPATATVLDLARLAPMLGMTAERAQDMPWMWLEGRLRAHDTYDPAQNIVPMKDRPMRSHPRTPEAAAQDAIDIVHEIHLAKGRDWNQELPLHPEAAEAEFQNALDATITEATTLWIGRKQDVPLANEIEEIRQYIAPRLAGYFPEDMRDRLLQTESKPATLPRIKDGPQGARELMTALVFGEIREVTVNGEKVDFAEQTGPQLAMQMNRGTGSWGGPDVQRLNYLLGQELTKYLEECEEVSKADIVGGPTTPMPDGTFEGPSEAFFQNPANPGIKGSARTDMAIRIRYGDQECIFSINTVDVTGKGALTARELRNLQRAVAHAGAMVSDLDATEKRWKKTIIQDRRIASENAFATLKKPADRSEAELKTAIEDFLSRLTCAKIIAACKEGNGLVDTTANSGE